MRRILIIGGGFGGVYTAKYLISHLRKDRTVEIILINEKNYFLFTPLLHEVATGSLNHQHVVTPIREILQAPNFRFIQCRAQKILYNKKTVKTTGGDIKYDYLVIATGAKTNFYGIPGAQKYALPLKTLEEANTIRNRVIQNTEKAISLNRKEAEPYLTFVIVGGGPTGIELAGELEQFIDQYASLPTNAYLSVDNLKNVYSIGDCSYFVNQNQTKPIPRLAQAAQKAAIVCAHNIAADIKGGEKKKLFFKPARLVASIGKHFAIAEIGPIIFKGFFAWWLWRTIYLFKMVGWSNRFFIAYEWTLNLIFRRDTSQI